MQYQHQRSQKEGLMETKPFYLTSEFFVTLGTILAAIAGVFPVGGKTASLIVLVSGAAYAIARGLAKSGSSTVVPLPADEGDKGSP